MICTMKIKCKKGRYLGRDIHEIESPRKAVRYSNPLYKMENELFTTLYREGKQKDLSGNDLLSYMATQLFQDDRFEKIGHYCLDLDELVRQVTRCEKNEFNRISRFENICYLTQFNYFVTLTYDTAKIGDEQIFRVKIRKALSNMAYRFGWLCKGVFERGDEGNRLHVHLLLKVENGKMPGELYARAQYSTKRRRMEVITSNRFFDKFGKNEFRAIDPTDSSYGRAIRYIAKYICKSGERLFGSKNLTHEIVRDIDTENDVMYVEASFGKVYVLFQDLFWSEEKRKQETEKGRYTFADAGEPMADWFFVYPENVKGFAKKLEVIKQENVPEWLRKQTA